MLVIVDYGMGNLRSVEKAFKRINANPIVSSRIEDIEKATKLVLPGVGFFKSGMDRLNELGLVEVLTKKVVEEKTPILGICLGMQLFTSYSDEGDSNGLNWIKAETKSFQLENLKVPHMGWNTLEFDSESPLFKGIEKEDAFYFVHSYYVSAENSENALCKTDYGINFDSGICQDNILGVQFHPEKSHSTGLKLLTNFIENY
jgi:glutamine amidotransferase